MHELGLCEGIVEATLRRAQGRGVRSVRVRVGGHPVDADVVRQGVALAALGTVAQDATVDLVMDPAVPTCADCGAAGDANDPRALVACAQCGGVDMTISGSDGAVLESLVLDGTAPAQSPPAEFTPAQSPPAQSPPAEFTEGSPQR